MLDLVDTSNSTQECLIGKCLYEIFAMINCELYLDFLDLLGDPSLSMSYWLKYFRFIERCISLGSLIDYVHSLAQTLMLVKQHLNFKYTNI